MANKIRATKARLFLLYKYTNAKMNKNESLLTQHVSSHVIFLVCLSNVL